MKNSDLNKRFQATTHKLSLCTPIRSLLDYRVQPVGRRLNRDVGEKTMNTTIIPRRLTHVISLIILFALSPGCTSLSTPVEMSQADVDYFRSEAIRMVTDGSLIERDNGKTLMFIDQGEYDTKKPITYRVLSGGHPRFYVTIPMVTSSGGHAQEFEFDMATRHLIDVIQSRWEY